MITILVDADACPVKDEITRAAAECGARALFIAALQHAPREAFERGLIENGLDGADGENLTDNKGGTGNADKPGDMNAIEADGGVRPEYIIVERHGEAVDIAIMNRVRPGDIVVTQDFGLAAVVMQKGARALSPEGRLYRAEDVETMLERRHHTRQLRRQPGGTKKLGRKPPFTPATRERFAAQLRRLLADTPSAQEQ